MKSKRYELVILFTLASWGLGRGFAEWLGFKLFSDSISTNNWISFLSRVFTVHALIGLSLGLSTWLILHWLDFRPGRRIGSLLVGGFIASWLVGLSLVCFALDPNAGWAWNIGFSIIGALCGLVTGLVLRALVPGFGWLRLFFVTILFSAFFLFGLIMESRILFSASVPIRTTAQSAVCGMLAALVILFVTGKVQGVPLGWRETGLAMLSFWIGDILGALALRALGDNPLRPWGHNTILAAGYGVGIALAARRPRSIPFYAIVCVLGITLGRVFWLGAKGSFSLTSGMFFSLLIGGSIGLFLSVGVRRFSTVFLMVTTGVLAFWLATLIPYPAESYSLLWWLSDLTWTAVSGVILVWGMSFWGILKPAKAVI
jgi:hypothetical protein